MRVVLIRRLQRLFLIISLALVAGVVALAVIGSARFLPRGVDRLIFVTPTPERDQVAIISGHAGNDSGAVCGNSLNPSLQEVEVVAGVVEHVRARLAYAGKDVMILDEYDSRLNDLEADLLLSLHADSCVAASGYKAASPMNSAIPTTERRLIDCIDTHYAIHTGLPHHPNSITHDMIRYHAFRKVRPTTPAAILEIGFLGGDGQLLTEDPERVALGITESIFCFLQKEEADIQQ